MHCWATAFMATKSKYKVEEERYWRCWKVSRGHYCFRSFQGSTTVFEVFKEPLLFSKWNLTWAILISPPVFACCDDAATRFSICHQNSYRWQCFCFFLTLKWTHGSKGVFFLQHQFSLSTTAIFSKSDSKMLMEVTCFSLNQVQWRDKMALSEWKRSPGRGNNFATSLLTDLGLTLDLVQLYEEKSADPWFILEPKKICKVFGDRGLHVREIILQPSCWQTLDSQSYRLCCVTSVWFSWFCE